jgi:enoyl-[acyl-carrier-protein] reductase (NADH)
MSVKPAIERAASVRTGPAETAFTRISCSPRSQARYFTDASRVAFADARDLEGRFTDTPRDRFWLAVDVSAYSLVACARAAEPLMEKAGGGSIVTMTYLGGERAVPHYNVMGVAKATLDSSVKYLAWDLGS